MNRRRPPGATGSRPPGAIGETSPASSHANSYCRATPDGLLNAPTRESQPHLHPRKINGALWFGVDPSVNKRGRIYGIGSVQFRDIAPSETVSASLNRNLDNEMRISSLEDKFKTVNDNVEVVKEDLVALKAGIDTVKDEMSETRCTQCDHVIARD